MCVRAIAYVCMPCLTSDVLVHTMYPTGRGVHFVLAAN